MDFFSQQQKKTYHPRKAHQILSNRTFYFGVSIATLSVMPYILGFLNNEPNCKVYVDSLRGTVASVASDAFNWIMKGLIRVVPGMDNQYRTVDLNKVV